jgi:hypothetical protein
MGLWYRIFGSSEVEPAPAAILQHLQELGEAVRGQFSRDDSGWYAAELDTGAGTPLHLERFGHQEEGIRAELNNWAAWVETCDYSPNSVPLMEKIIQTRQLFTLRRPIDHPDDVLVEKLCVRLCRFLAETTAGIWQADDQGIFAADGSVLLQEY